MSKPSETTLIFRHGANSAEIGKITLHGAYLLQSEKVQELFRIGIAGLRGGSFHSRLSFHRRKQNPENWTTQNRPWKALWTLEVVNGNAQSIQMVEHLLYSVFSRDHQFVDGSGFKASPDQAATFVNMLIAREDDIAKVVEIQLGQLVKVHRL